MTEEQRKARIAAGYLWTDTDEYLAHPAGGTPAGLCAESTNMTRSIIGRIGGLTRGRRID